MGHSVGVSDSYARPTEQEMLQDYIRALNQLSINTEQRAAAHQLQKQVLELREQREQSNYIILGRLAEKDKQIEELKASVDKLIKTEVNMARVNDWMNENVHEKIEQLIWEYMSPDPADGSLPCDAQEFERRKRKLPELLREAKKLRAQRLAVTASADTSISNTDNGSNNSFS